MFALFGAEVSGLEGPALGSSLVGLPGFCLGGPIGHGGLLPERPGGVVGGGPPGRGTNPTPSCLSNSGL